MLGYINSLKKFCSTSENIDINFDMLFIKSNRYPITSKAVFFSFKGIRQTVLQKTTFN